MIYSLDTVCEDLGVSQNDVIEAVKKLDAPVLLRLPDNAKLVLTELLLRNCSIPSYEEKIDLSDADYACLPSKKLEAVIHNWPNVVDYFDRLLRIDQQSSELCEVDWHQILPIFNIWVMYQSPRVIKSLEPEKMPSWGSSIRFLQETYKAIKLELDDPLGGFKPRGETAKSIKDMNQAFSLFRIKKRLEDNSENRAYVKNWLAERWNTPGRKQSIRGSKSLIGDSQLKYAARLLLERDISAKIGDIEIPEAVQQQHHPNAPDWLMLLEYLDQLQVEYHHQLRELELKTKRKHKLFNHQRKRIKTCLKKASSPRQKMRLQKISEKLEVKISAVQFPPHQSPLVVDYGFRFKTNSLLKQNLQELEVGPTDYRNLVSRLLTMDAE